MRRTVNFRFALFAAVGLCVGIYSFYEFLFGNFWFGLVAVIVAVVLGVTFFIEKSRFWIGLAVILTSIAVGFASANLSYELLSRNEATGKDVLLTGRVCDLNRNNEGQGAVYLEDCEDSDGTRYRGRVETYIFGAEIHSGDVVVVRGTLNSVYPIKSSVETYLLRSDIRYELEVKLLVSAKAGDLNAGEAVRKYIYDVSTEYAPRNGDVLYALFTGDRSALDGEKEEYFKAAGIIHLLAVSGLHVGFVVTVLCLVLKRFKLHPLIECGVLLVPLVFYAYMCSFTPSVVRAIVMVACGYVAKALFGRYDLLTSLSWAVVVILVISPFNLFDVGFQLSALSVYGIATIYKALNLFLTRRKIRRVFRYILNSLAISFSCSLATFFTLQLYYGYAPTLGILLNIVVIPLITAVFVLGWLGMLPWVFHYVLFALDWVLEGVVAAAKWTASLSFSAVSVAAISATVLIVVAWLFVLGGYVNLRKAGKIVVNSALACVVALCVGLSFVKTSPQNQAYVVYGYNDVICVATSSDGEAAIVGNLGDKAAYFKAAKYLGSLNVTHCDLYITDYGATDVVIVEELLRNFPIKTAYRLDFAYNADADAVFNSHGVDVCMQMSNTSHGGNVTVSSIYDGGLRSTLISVNGLKVSIVYGEAFAVANYLNLDIFSHVYVLPTANDEYALRQLTTLSRYQSDLPLNYGANKYGNFTITQKDDTIKISFR